MIKHIFLGLSVETGVQVFHIIMNKLLFKVFQNIVYY